MWLLVLIPPTAAAFAEANAIDAWFEHREGVLYGIGGLETVVDLNAKTEGDGGDDGDNGGGNTPSGGSTNTGGSSTTRQYALNISSADTSMGTVNDSINKTYSEGSRVTITATPKAGYQFEKWSDGNTSANRNLTIDKAYTLVATFVEQSGDSTDTGNTGGGSAGYL